MHDPAYGMLFLIVVVVLYFLPTFIARTRKHHNTMAIFLLNLLLGWTGLGWVAALIWAATAVRPDMIPPKENRKSDIKIEPVGTGKWSSQKRN